MFIVKLINLLFSVCFATGYIHSGKIKIFTSKDVDNLSTVGLRKTWNVDVRRFPGLYRTFFLRRTYTDLIRAIVLFINARVQSHLSGYRLSG